MIFGLQLLDLYVLFLVSLVVGLVTSVLGPATASVVAAAHVCRAVAVGYTAFVVMVLGALCQYSTGFAATSTLLLLDGHLTSTLAALFSGSSPSSVLLVVCAVNT